MSRITTPAEKIVAVGSIYKALITELDLGPLPEEPEPQDPVVIASLIDASVKIAMSTDTRDMGLLGIAPPLPPIQRRPEDMAGEPDGEPLWGPEGPTVGQVITIRDTDQQVRWTGSRWVPAEEMADAHD